MVIVGSDFQEWDLVTVAYVNANTAQDRFHLIGDDSTAVFGGANCVIQERGNIVAFVDKFAHTSAVYRTN